jgi:transcriptional regulator with XRE-family HTH domain
MSQIEAAARLGVLQALLSLMEKGKRAVTLSVVRKAVLTLKASPSILPVSLLKRRNDDQLAAEFGVLCYPGYSHLHGTQRNPAELLLDALDRPELDARLVEALPWLPLHYPNMNWEWTTAEAKLRNRQNRLGFMTALARNLAIQLGQKQVADNLAKALRPLEEARLAKVDTLCQESWPPSQRQFAHKHRSKLPALWNLDPRLTEDDLARIEKRLGR